HRSLAYKHISLAHFKERPFPCGFCDHDFQQKLNLEDHIDLIHCGVKEIITSLRNINSNLTDIYGS
ncbi:hypothetical protein B4U80_01020, partial [Leptotrombidium deliense]